jgi:hypothetical protein
MRFQLKRDPRLLSGLVDRQPQIGEFTYRVIQIAYNVCIRNAAQKLGINSLLVMQPSTRRDDSIPHLVHPWERTEGPEAEHNT